mgnify:CR=1 FL=1
MRIKTFSQLKEGDYIYRITNQIDKKPNDKEFGGLIFHAPEEYYDFRIENLEIESVKPWVIEHHYNYMKMNGDRPCGIGTSISKEIDNEHVRIQFKSSNIPCGFSYHIFNNNDSNYISYDKRIFYFTNKKQAITMYKSLIDTRITELKETINQLNNLKKISNNI